MNTFIASQLKRNSHIQITNSKSNLMNMAIEDNIEEFGNSIPKILLNNPIGNYKISFILSINNILYL
jgi:hypothetical protein